jgi:hypothetical protein
VREVRARVVTVADLREPAEVVVPTQQAIVDGVIGKPPTYEPQRGRAIDRLEGDLDQGRASRIR